MKEPSVPRPRHFVPCGALGALAAALLLLAGMPGARAQGAEPGGIEPGVAAIGFLEPGEGVVLVAAPRYLGPSIVRELRVDEGDAVAKGQVLALLDSHARLSAALGEAARNLDAARERRDWARKMAEGGEETLAQEARVRMLKAELDNLDSESRRADSLARKGSATAAEREAAESRRVAKSEEMNQAQNLLTYLKAKWGNEYRMAGIGVDQAEWAYQRASAELELTVVRAPLAGRVLEVKTREGEEILDGGMLALGETGRMYAVAEVYQSDVPRVKLGAKARITSDLPGLELTGVVEKVGVIVRKNSLTNPDIAADIDARIVKVRIRLDRPEVAAGLTNLRVTVAIP